MKAILHFFISAGGPVYLHASSLFPRVSFPNRDNRIQIMLVVGIFLFAAWEQSIKGGQASKTPLKTDINKGLFLYMYYLID